MQRWLRPNLSSWICGDGRQWGGLSSTDLRAFSPPDTLNDHLRRPLLHTVVSAARLASVIDITLTESLSSPGLGC